MLIKYTISILIIIGACPYDEAFIDLIRGDLNHDGQINGDEVKSEWYPKSGLSENMANEVTATRAHRYAECSNVGLCDRTSGDCKCFPGYEGSACQRHSCPTAVEGTYCSGHGICESTGDYYKVKASQTPNWEFDKFYKCKCDKGWDGIMCDSRICPTGIDPVVQKQHDFSFSYDIDLSKVTELDSKKELSTYYVINYDGVKYTTPEVKIENNICPTSTSSLELSKAANIQEDIRRSLLVVPPFTQSSVLVKCNGENTLSVNITAEYTDVNKYVEQCKLDTEDSKDPNGVKMFSVHEIIVDKDGKVTDTPIDVNYYYLGNEGKKYCNVLLEAIGNNNISIKQPTCSNRGVCNGETGLCECYTGYYGSACENLRSYLV